MDSLKGEKFITVFLELWGKYRHYHRCYTQVLSDLDENFLKKEGKPLDAEGFKLLQEEVIEKNKTKLLEAIATQVNSIRDGEDVDEAKIAAAVSVFYIASFANNIKIE